MYETAKIYSLEGLADYQDGAIVSKTVMKKETGNVSIFAFDKSQGLSEHTAPFDAMVTILDGKGEIRISGAPYNLNIGDFIIMPANEPHAVFAHEPFKMMLIMIKSK